MPIKRKICKIGTGRAIFLPKSWLDLIEEEHGQIEAVAMEVDGILTIKPLLKNNSNEHLTETKPVNKLTSVTSLAGSEHQKAKTGNGEKSSVLENKPILEAQETEENDGDTAKVVKLVNSLTNRT